jgi:hypothetical protein
MRPRKRGIVSSNADQGRRKRLEIRHVEASTKARLKVNAKTESGSHGPFGADPVERSLES